MQIQGIPRWAERAYQCVERQLAKPEVSWKFDWNFPHFDDKYSGLCESYMGLDETLADQAREQPGLVVLQNTNGTRVTASGDSKSGYYVEASDKSLVVAKFSGEAVDHVTIDPEGACEWMHVDRKQPKRSFQLIFEVDPSTLEVESLAKPPLNGGLEVRPGAVVVGGSTVRTRNG